MLDDVLRRVARGELTPEQAARELNLGQVEAVGEAAKFDLGREHRTGIPECVLAEGKTTRQVLDIVAAALRHKDAVLVTRCSGEVAERLGGLEGAQAERDDESRLVLMKRRGAELPRTGGVVGVLTGGTSDIPIAREAQRVAEMMGCATAFEADVGVAGLQRLFPALRRVLEAKPDVLVVAAGREGTLPTIVAGLAPVPVIGLPVSVGYGKGGAGEAALASMLQSCSPMAVVNIDAGFVAGAVAAQFANAVARARSAGR